MDEGSVAMYYKTTTQQQQQHDGTTKVLALPQNAVYFPNTLFQDPFFVDSHVTPHTGIPSNVIESQIAIGGDGMQDSV